MSALETQGAVVEDGSLGRAVWDALAGVADPEIPAVSVVDMGMVERVVVDEASGEVGVTMLPTFSGCPAVDVIKMDVRAALEGLRGVSKVDVAMTFSPPWTSARITAEGRVKLSRFGLAPPTGQGPVLISDIALPKAAICPFCGSRETHNENPFGPTPCRALYYCRACRNPFEQFKPV